MASILRPLPAVSLSARSLLRPALPPPPSSAPVASAVAAVIPSQWLRDIASPPAAARRLRRPPTTTTTETLAGIPAATAPRAASASAAAAAAAAAAPSDPSSPTGRTESVPVGAAYEPVGAASVPVGAASVAASAAASAAAAGGGSRRWMGSRSGRRRKERKKVDTEGGGAGRTAAASSASASASASASDSSRSERRRPRGGRRSGGGAGSASAAGSAAAPPGPGAPAAARTPPPDPGGDTTASPPRPPPALLTRTASPFAYVASAAALESGIDPLALFSECRDRTGRTVVPPSFRRGRFEYLSPRALRGEVPNFPIPEVALLGRSNAGKSSLINALTGGRRDLARVSKRPGRTQRVNYFALVPGDRVDVPRSGGRAAFRPSESTAFVIDLPGYGYAAAPLEEVRRWQANTQSFLEGRRDAGNLARVYLLIDSRRGLTPIDEGVMGWFDDAGIPYGAVLTKSDRVGRPRIVRAANEVCARYHGRRYGGLGRSGGGGGGGGGGQGPMVHVTSAAKGDGVLELMWAMDEDFAAWRREPAGWGWGKTGADADVDAAADGEAYAAGDEVYEWTVPAESDISAEEDNEDEDEYEWTVPAEHVFQGDEEVWDRGDSPHEEEGRTKR